MEQIFNIHCPYCGELLELEFYLQDGHHQDTIIDCEVCCHPISTVVKFNSNGERHIIIDQAQ